MSAETPAPEGLRSEPRSAFTQRYGGGSRLAAEGEEARLALFADLSRAPVSLQGLVQDPIRLREALSALYEIVQSDLRYKPKDRTAYLAHQRMRQQNAGASQWAAQRAYHQWLLRNDPLAWMILDPIVTVQPDALLFEVFSKDEGSYAQLSLELKGGLKLKGKPQCGTTNIDFSQALYDGVQRIRSYRKTQLSIGQEAVQLSVEGEAETLEKRVQIPDSWLRGFLQVQSAASLPSTQLSLAPMDLYNLLSHLRLNADQKRQGRALRFELLPGEAPRIVLEPWEEVLESGAEIYSGSKPQVIRVWGRRRLMLLRRFLPFVESVEVRLLGSGMPSFFILKAGAISLSLGMTGFSASNWTASLAMDVMLPRPEGESEELQKVMAWLQERWKGSLSQIAKGAKLKSSQALAALQEGCQHGQLLFDLAQRIYRLRPLSVEPLEPARLRYRNDRERQAHDLLVQDGAVRISQENRIHGQGLEITGKVVVAAEKREYRLTLLLNEEGQVRRGECSCALFRKHRFKEGPCAHLIALRLLQARQAQERGARKDRRKITVETRIYSRRLPEGEQLSQLSLNRKRLRIRWGARSDPRLRMQNLLFDTVAEARAAYFAQIEALESKGYLDATGG